MLRPTGPASGRASCDADEAGFSFDRFWHTPAPGRAMNISVWSGADESRWYHIQAKTILASRQRLIACSTRPGKEKEKTSYNPLPTSANHPLPRPSLPPSPPPTRPVEKGHSGLLSPSSPSPFHINNTAPHSRSRSNGSLPTPRPAASSPSPSAPWVRVGW